MQYPTIAQPQYGFAPTMPGMASGGLASLPIRRFQSGGSTGPYKYSYDPKTQRYTLLSSGEQANQMLAAQGKLPPYEPSGPGSESNAPPGSPAQIGSSGVLGGLAQNVGGAISGLKDSLGVLAYAIPGVMTAEKITDALQDKAIEQNAIVDAQLAKANEQANQARTSIGGLFSLAPTVTTAVDISPVAGSVPGTQQVTSIAPDVVAPGLPVTDLDVNVDPTAALTAMNVQQTDEQDPSNLDISDIAATLAATADAVGADTSVSDAAAAAAAAAATGGTGTGNDAGVGGEGGGGGGGGGGMGPNDGPGQGDPSGGSEGTGTGNDAGTFYGGGRVMNYEQGGVASLANRVQERGRGQDTMLVHMTPGEVKGLQALAMSQGGSLTINPQTGLPEAGFLSAILPMVAGFALGPAGFQMMSALQAGLTVGALTGIATGSLKKGLMAGLGAYGGAGLGEGLQAAAGTPENLISANPPYNPDLLTTYGPPPTTPLGIGSEGASISAGTYTPTPAVTPDVSSFSGSAGDFGIPSTPTGPVPGSGYAGSLPSEYPFKNVTYGDTGQALGSVAKDTTYAQLPPPPPVQATGIDAITGGTKAMIQPGAEGAAARARFGAALPYGTTIAAGVPLASAAAEPPKGPEPSKSYIRGYDLDITNPSGTPQYTPQDTREREQVRYAYRPREIYEAAQGGLTALNGQTYDDEYGRDEYKAGGQAKTRSKSLRGNPYYKFAQDRKDSSMEAAIEQNFAKGGLPPRFLSGGGDGMSDSIKARIGGVQEARLADGEFVVPADVVSHLGNGSSKAGAKKLYAMMDKIRKARTGRERQAPEVNARRYMPA